MWCIIKEIISAYRGGEIIMERRYNVLDLALYIINYCNEKGNSISNLQLQKIVYYVQAAFLVERGKPCFDEEIVHWTYGPVVEKVYNEFRGYGFNPIPKDARYIDVVFNNVTNKVEIHKHGFDNKLFMNSDGALINRVVDAYSGFEPFKLVNKTHKESPWMDTLKNQIITKESIRNYYLKNPNKIYGE